MSWLKSGDNAATYPLLLEVGMQEGADDRILNEVAGFVWRCASQSAGHLTNSVIDQGTAFLLGGSRARALLEVAVTAGLIAPVMVDGRSAHKLIEDPDFLHIRDRESVRWDQQRDRDRKTPELTTAVRRRDGDACRYCGCVVNFAARKGGRSGTYDHYEPGKPASIETYVVACRSHNSSMSDGERLPLLDPPAQPYYTARTLAWLEDNGRKPPKGSYVTEPRPEDDRAVTEGGHRRDTARPTPSEDPVTQRDPDTAATGATRTPQLSPTPVVDTAAQRDPDTAATGATRTPQLSATHDSAPAKLSPAETGHPPRSRSDLGKDSDRKGGAWAGRDGTGRVRSVRAGPGLGGAGASPAGAGRRRSRGRRSSRGGSDD